MLLSRQFLLSRPYRYIYLLYDFIHRRSFKIGLSELKLSFDYMGNPYKFYTPEQFTSSHDVHDALSWMKTTDIFFKHKDDIYPLESLYIPEEYDNGDVSDIRHVFYGLAILAKLHTGKKTISRQDVVNMVGFIKNTSANVSKDKVILIETGISPNILNIINDSMFSFVLNEDIRHACNFVNSIVVSSNIDSILNLDKYKIKLVIGGNRGITKHDVKLYQYFKSNLKEIKLANRAN